MKVHPFAACLPLLKDAELERLAADIKANGQRNPIILLDGQVLDGRNRLAACKLAKVAPKTREWSGGVEAARAMVWSQNVLRRHLPPDQQGAIFLKLAAVADTLQAKVVQSAKADAKARQRASGGGAGRRGGDKRTVVQPFAQPKRDERKSRAAEAKAAGVSHETLRQLGKLPAADLDAVAEGAERLADVRKRQRLEDRKTRHSEIMASNTALPIGERKYVIIYADPPWLYECNTENDRAVENHYPTMDHAALLSLPVERLAADDAVLLMWATAPKLMEAGALITAWGFRYTSCACWDKGKIGIGSYFRIQHELLLVATRGTTLTPAPDARPSSMLVYPRGQHSVKPVEVYSLLERMWPDVPRIELFARGERPGWDVWGNQSG